MGPPARRDPQAAPPAALGPGVQCLGGSGYERPRPPPLSAAVSHPQPLALPRPQPAFPISDFNPPGAGVARRRGPFTSRASSDRSFRAPEGPRGPLAAVLSSVRRGLAGFPAPRVSIPTKGAETRSSSRPGDRSSPLQAEGGTSHAPPHAGVSLERLGLGREGRCAALRLLPLTPSQSPGRASRLPDKCSPRQFPAGPRGRVIRPRARGHGRGARPSPG